MLYLHRGALAVSLSVFLGSQLLAYAVQAQPRSLDHVIEHYQHLLQQHPANASLYYRLGDAYLQKSRDSGDVAYVNLAEQALRQALHLAPRLSKAQRHLAQALYSRHAFAEAITAARQALSLDPADSHAYAVLGDAAMELGQYEQAQEAYQQMARRDTSLYSYSRLAGLKSLQGDPQSAIADLQRALLHAQLTHVPAENIAWLYWQLGQEYEHLGNVENATTAYRTALNIFPGYHRAAAGMARMHTVQRRDVEAIPFYQQALAVLPLPEYTAALGDVYHRLGRQEEADKQYALIEYIGLLQRRDQALYNRELALFYLQHDRNLDEALTLAHQELQVRQDIYAYDLLAWALYKNHQPQEALAAMQRALALGTQDARLFFHAAIIYHNLGDMPQAHNYAQRTLTLNPTFPLLHPDPVMPMLITLAQRAISAQEQSHGH